MPGAQVVIGRSAECEVSIPDTSVSRKHVTLRRTGEDWLASDMGSGNGTFLNDKPLTEELPLKSGDVLTMGDTKLQYVDAEGSIALAVAEPIPASIPVRRHTGGVQVRGRVARAGRSSTGGVARQKSRRVLLYGIGALALMVCLVVGGKIIQSRQQATKLKLLEGKTQLFAQLEAKFEEGKNLARAGKWRQAKEHFEEIQVQDASFPGVADYLERAVKEVPNQKHLEDAQQALSNNQLGPAALALSKVSSDTLQFEQVDRARRSMAEKVNDQTNAARSAMEAQNADEALRIASDVLRADPDNLHAKMARDQAQEAIEERERPKPIDRGPIQKVWEPAVRKFQDGDISAAIDLAKSCGARGTARCKALVKELTEYNGLFRNLDSLDEEKLTRLLSLDRRITDGRGSKMRSAAGLRAAAMFYKRASAAQVKEDWSRAVEYLQKTLDAQPGHEGARALKTSLRQRAEEIFGTAYSHQQQGDTLKAETLFRAVTKMTPPDDKFHQMAKKRLQGVER